jgi:signal transduction histidine kinase/CheY-like chemotaxis protein/HAMP domain-containing protein
MIFKNLKIGTQLIIGFAILLLLVMVLSMVSLWQTNKIHDQTDLLYNHSLQVRCAVGEITVSANQLHWAMEVAMSFDDYEQMKPYVKIIEQNDVRIQKNLTILELDFLGPHEFIEATRTAISECKQNRDFVLHLIQAGNRQQADKINIHSGTVLGSDHLNEINEMIERISQSTFQKANTLYAESGLLKNKLRDQLLIVILFILVIALFINYVLLRNIRSPLIWLTDATHRFDRGDISSRCAYESKNELGKLAASFNMLAENIQINSDINEKSAILTGRMLSENDAKCFFKTTLEILMDHAGAQLGAVYLLSKDETSFGHFVSVGADDAAKESFSATEAEGEFGMAVQTQKIQYIKDIPEDTRFVFHTTAGKFIPREIITVPVSTDHKVVAIISLASLNRFGENAMRLLNEIYPTYCARTGGIMAFQRNKEFAERIGQQNRELENQSAELSAQAAELKEKNIELEIQKNEISEANRLKTSFLSNMSHELRTPLNSVIALSGVLGRRLAGEIPDEDYSYLEIIERNGKNLLHMINDILDIARIESGREEIEVSEFFICNCIGEVEEMIRPQAEQKKIAFHPVNGDCQTKITSDVNKFKHIMQNLIGNAVKFTEKGSVDISIRKRGDAVEIYVVDTGIGIEADQLPYIFDEFRQVDSGNSRQHEGTGLGLAIAKKYACMLGGDIGVESSPGQGATFTLSLPLVFDAERKTNGDHTQVQAEPEIEAEPAKPASKKGRQTILLVEDSEPAIIQIQDFLQSSGYKTLVARDGAKALQNLSHTIPDAIILDLMMPGIDGFEVLRKLRSDNRTAHIPVLILTAKHITQEELKFLKRNNIYQLIQKGDIKRGYLLKAIRGMTAPKKRRE